MKCSSCNGSGWISLNIECESCNADRSKGQYTPSKSAETGESPRTDALLKDWVALDTDIEHCSDRHSPPTWAMYDAMRDLARQLERELAEAVTAAEVITEDWQKLKRASLRSAIEEKKS